MIKEFKEFAMRGNVIDLAVGIIIGGAFGKIVDALVKNIIMPPIELALKLGENAKGEAVVLGYGAFIQTVVDFLIIAFSIFMMIKIMNKAQSLTGLEEEKKDEAPKPPPEDIQLLREIRDSLQKN
ncbi:UNVERIFIED_CONTAM: hypothetical protein GTU68_062911 [Idotea baltica]|nr:hypothetical protein [Idotea baltica]